MMSCLLLNVLGWSTTGVLLVASLTVDNDGEVPDLIPVVVEHGKRLGGVDHVAFFLYLAMWPFSYILKKWIWVGKWEFPGSR